MTDSTRDTRYTDGSGWEDAAGYSRAARRGDLIAVSGTTATDDVATGHPTDTERQANDAIRRALEAVRHLGGDVGDVIRTRMYLAPDADWRMASQVHATHLGAIAPANTTLYVHRLIGPDFLVEIEIDAIVGGGANNGE